MKMLKWKLEVTIAVAESWVADGFEATPERIKEFIEDKLLGYAYEHEKSVAVRTLVTPDAKRIQKLQGSI